MVKRKRARDPDACRDGGSRQILAEEAEATQPAQSILASTLIMMFVWGAASAELVQRIAAAAAQDGFAHPEFFLPRHFSQLSGRPGSCMGIRCLHPDVVHNKDLGPDGHFIWVGAFCLCATS